MPHSTTPSSQLPDLLTCDKEPIHVIGAIQPHGLLLAVEGPDAAIVHVSVNCRQWLDQSPEQLVGSSLDALLSRDSVAWAMGCGDTTTSVRTLHFAFADREPMTCLASAHRSGDAIIIEVERVPADIGETSLRLMGACRIASRRLGKCGSVEELARAATEELSKLTGLDRIMVYQFDDEFNGSVIAEHCEEDMEPYLGLHYPASDIPAQARAIFLSNGLRVIPDAQFQPVPLFPSAHSQTHRPLDLSRAHLRSVSPVHLEYLRNMGVAASLTISLVVDGKLWGLIACHHRTPRFPSPALREACELFGQMASMQLTDRLHAVGETMAERSDVVLRRIAERVQKSNQILPALMANPKDLLELTDAHGAVLWRDGEAAPVGVTPPLGSIGQFHRWAAEATAEPIFVTDFLAKRFPGAEAYAETASGMIALVVSRDPDVSILWFLPEVIATVDWAGDPNKSSSQDGSIHPRKSFARWKDSVRNRSRPWLKAEIEVVERLRSILLDQLARTAEYLARLLPICAWCRKVRTDRDYWEQVEAYVEAQFDVRFTHGICPECFPREKAKLQQIMKGSK